MGCSKPLQNKNGLLLGVWPVMLMGEDQLLKNGHALHVDVKKETKLQLHLKNDFLGVNERKENNPTTKKHDNIVTIKARTPGVASAIL